MATKLSPLSWVFVNETSILQHVCPLATGSSMAMLQVLTEVIGTVELLVGVALSEFVDFLQMSDPLLPILICSMSRNDAAVEGAASWSTTRSGKFQAAVAASICFTRMTGGVMESAVIAS